MDNYEKSVVVDSEELAEGVYAASGAVGVDVLKQMVDLSATAYT